MISRRSAIYIAELYFLTFSDNYGIPEVTECDTESLRRFLFAKDYDTWFLDHVRHLEGDYDSFSELFFGLHTGQTVLGAPISNRIEDRQQLGRQTLLRLAKDLLEIYVPGLDEPSVDQQDEVYKQGIRDFLAQLELDGYIYRNGNLYPAESSVIDEQAEQSYLDNLIDSLHLSDPTTIKHHIRLAEEDYRGGRWSNSIGNSRHFLEAILAQVLERVSATLNLNLNSSIYRNATDTREHLQRNGLLAPDEKETIGRIYGLLSNIGGHAYIAEKDQARLMWHLALTCSQFVLLRYEGFVRAHP